MRLNIDLRQYTLADSRALVATIDAVCAEGRWMHTTRFEPTPAWEHALAHPGDPSHLLLVARIDGQVVGWCRAFPVDRRGVAEIGVGLLGPYRNRGLGTRMLQMAIEWARQRGLRQITLTTRADNVRAIHTFRKCGFQKTGDDDGGWIEMTLRL